MLYKRTDSIILVCDSWAQLVINTKEDIAVHPNFFILNNKIVNVLDLDMW